MAPKKDKSAKYLPGRLRRGGNKYVRTIDKHGVQFSPPADLPLPQRAEDGTPPDPIARIKYIKRLMAAGAFVRGITCGDLADAWGLSDEALKRDAAEASRAIKIALDEAGEGELLAQWIAVQSSIIAKTMQKGEYVVAERANTNMAKISGIAAPDKHAVTTDLGGLFADVLNEMGSGEAAREPAEEDPSVAAKP